MLPAFVTSCNASTTARPLPPWRSRKRTYVAGSDAGSRSQACSSTDAEAHIDSTGPCSNSAAPAGAEKALVLRLAERSASSAARSAM